MGLEVETKTLNVRETIAKITLAEWPHSLLPATQPANAMATKKEQLIKKGVKTPLVYVNLREFVPHWCCNRAQESGTDKTEDSKHLRLAQWGPAFERYALAAAADNQWSLAASSVYKDIVMQARFSLMHSTQYFDLCSCR